MVQKRDDARQFLKYLHRDLGVGTIHMIYSLMFLCISSCVVLEFDDDCLCSVKLCMQEGFV